MIESRVTIPTTLPPAITGICCIPIVRMRSSRESAGSSGAAQWSLVLGEHHRLHRGDVPILLRDRMQRLGRHESHQLFMRDHQMRAAARAHHFPGIVFQ